MRKSLVVTMSGLVALGLASASKAEFINIDVNGNGQPPPFSFAAAALAGLWNAYGGTGTSAPLFDLNNALTDVTITTVGGFGIYSSTSLGYTGGLADLLNDVVDSATSLTIANLDAGNYDIYTYATDPDVPTTAGTIITIGGASQNIIGPAVVGGVLIQGTHYAKHSIVHPGGSLVIGIADLPGGNGFWNVNGVQIVPEPGSLALLGLGVLGVLRRRP